MDKDEALKLALCTFNTIHNDPKSFFNCMEVITAIEEALAQPLQEPVCNKEQKGYWQYIPARHKQKENIHG